MQKNTALCIDFMHKYRVLVEATGFEGGTAKQVTFILKGV
jgi:hypothetical protein